MGLRFHRREPDSVVSHLTGRAGKTWWRSHGSSLFGGLTAVALTTRRSLAG